MALIMPNPRAASASERLATMVWSHSHALLAAARAGACGNVRGLALRLDATRRAPCCTPAQARVIDGTLAAAARLGLDMPPARQTEGGVA